MSRSPVLQQQPTLTFTDQDLTDNYRDTASSSSAASHRSAGSHSTNNRHPRGDTPLSYGGRRGGSGRATGGEWESGSSATSAATRSSDRRIQREGGEDDRSMPSLSRLMAFLDDEDDDEDTRLQHQPPPQTCSPSLSYIHRQQLLRSSTPPVPSPAPHPPHQHDDQHTQTTTQSTVVAASESTASPSLRAHSRSQLRRTDPSLSNPRATLPSATARPTRLDGEGEELPDSPSPLPGSVAGLSWRQAQQGSVLGNGGQGYGGQRAGAGREEEQQEVEEVTLLYEGGVREEAGRWEAGGVRTEGERDGIAALADEVLSEFTSIINSAPNSPHQPRPRSRLRNIPSPRESGQGSTSPHLPTSIEEAEELRTSEEEGGEARRGKRVPGSWRNGSLSAPAKPVHRHVPPSPASPAAAFSSQPHPHSQQDLILELREARSYIARLQGQVRELGEVVGALRGSNGTPAEMARRRDPAPVPPPRVDHGERPLHLDGSPSDTLAVAQNLIALLPSATTSSLSTLPRPSLHSISLALSFVRDIDSLVHTSQAPTPLTGEDTGEREGGAARGEWRRDEQVFQWENLELVRRRLKGWERSVRGRQ